MAKQKLRSRESKNGGGGGERENNSKTPIEEKEIGADFTKKEPDKQERQSGRVRVVQLCVSECAFRLRKKGNTVF